MNLPNVTYNPPEPPVYGIVFLHATWSGYSVLGLQRFSNSIKEYKDIPLYIYDIDSLEYILFAEKYTIRSHGYGELYRVENGAAEFISKVKNTQISIS
jgi:hypothetical protein